MLAWTKNLSLIYNLAVSMAKKWIFKRFDKEKNLIFFCWHNQNIPGSVSIYGNKIYPYSSIWYDSVVFAKINNQFQRPEISF